MGIIPIFRKLHALIKGNPDLINKIRALVSDPSNQNSNSYLITGLQVEGIYLGLDFKENHLAKFWTILANTAAVDSLSHQKASVARVLLPIYLNGKHVATLTEDVSQNGVCKIYDNGISWGPYHDYLVNFFVNTNDLIKAVFVIEPPKKKKINTEMNDPEVMISILRVIDVDHIELTPTFAPLYEETITTFKDDPIFSLSV